MTGRKPIRAFLGLVGPGTVRQGALTSYPTYPLDNNRSRCNGVTVKPGELKDFPSLYPLLLIFCVSDILLISYYANLSDILRI